MTQTLPRRISVRNPRTGQNDFEITAATGADIAEQAARLRRGQSAWAQKSLEERIAVLQRWAERVQSCRNAITTADSTDTGYGQISRVAVDMTLGHIRRYSLSAAADLKAAMRQGQSPQNPLVRYDCVLKPIPLVGVISPWNGPMHMAMLHAIPPLFAGCAVLVKPSEVTPRFVGPLRSSIQEVPELAAVFDFVLGDGATGAALIEHVDMVSFTGSVSNGRKVAEACGRRLIPCELELGGKDPIIVTSEADLDAAASAVLRGGVTSTGQVCFAIERVYVDAKVHDDFVSRLVNKAERVQINYPDPLSGHIGPFISHRQAQLVDAHLEEAIAKGAVLRCGGKSFNRGGGLYMLPTVLTDVTHDMLVMREETFGPVIPVMRYNDIEEAVSLANDSLYGLSAAVMAGSEAEALTIARLLNAGNVSVQDAYLTFFAGPAESDKFASSGVPGKRSGLQRYLRREALLINSGKPACLLEQSMQSL